MSRPIVVLLVAATLGRSLSAQGSIAGRVTQDAEPVPGAVVYLVPAGSVAPPPTTSPVIDQRNLRFRPSLVVVTPGSIVGFLNSDSLLHNVFSPGGPGGPFDLGTYATGERRAQAFTEVGTHVILCHVHPEMVAYVVVVPTPWFAVTDSTGHYEVLQVPPGLYRATVAFRRRHQSSGTVAIGTGARMQRDFPLGRQRPSP